MTRSPRPLPSVSVYCKWSNTGNGNAVMQYQCAMHTWNCNWWTCRGAKTDLVVPAAKLTSSKVEFVVQVCNGFLFPTAPTVQVTLLLSMSGWYSVHHLCMDGWQSHAHTTLDASTHTSIYVHITQSPHHIWTFFNQIQYKAPPISSQGGLIPRLFLASIPGCS